MARIYLARHGQDTDNAQGVLNGHRDTTLTGIGTDQARSLAQKITESNFSIQKVISSPLMRALSTAEIIAERLRVPVEKLDLLKERDFGVMTGKQIKDIKQMCAPDIIETETITYFLSPEGAETFPELLKRGHEVLKWIEKNVPDTDILLVSHSDIGKMIYTAFYDLDWRQVLHEFHFGNSEMLLLSPGTKPGERILFQTKQYNL